MGLIRYFLWSCYIVRIILNHLTLFLYDDQAPRLLYWEDPTEFQQMEENGELPSKMLPISDFAGWENKHNQTIEFAVKKFIRNFPPLLIH